MDGPDDMEKQFHASVHCQKNPAMRICLACQLQRAILMAVCLLQRLRGTQPELENSCHVRLQPGKRFVECSQR